MTTGKHKKGIQWPKTLEQRGTKCLMTWFDHAGRSGKEWKRIKVKRELILNQVFHQPHFQLWISCLIQGYASDHGGESVFFPQGY
jgi:hypothetical protein